MQDDTLAKEEADIFAVLHIAKNSWKTLALVTLAMMVLAYAYRRLTPMKWEAKAVVEIGKVPSFGALETPDVFIQRIEVSKSTYVQELGLQGKEKDLFADGLSAKRIGETVMMRLALQSTTEEQAASNMRYVIKKTLQYHDQLYSDILPLLTDQLNTLDTRAAGYQNLLQKIAQDSSGNKSQATLFSTTDAYLRALLAGQFGSQLSDLTKQRLDLQLSMAKLNSRQTLQIGDIIVSRKRPSIILLPLAGLLGFCGGLALLFIRKGND